MQNILQPFLFANLPVRGRILQLSDLSSHVPTLQSAQEACAQTLTELLAAAALLAHDAKHTLAVSLQIQHAELGALIFAQCSLSATLKAYANPAAQATPFESYAKVPGGIFAVTMEPKEIDQRYQSLIPLTHATAAGCLADYFKNSVQTPTHFVVFGNHERALAVMLQALPAKELPEDDWNRLALLLKTLNTEEALDPALTPQTLLERLFAEDDLTLYTAETPEFAHDDPRPRMLAALASLPADELKQLIANAPVTLTDNTSGQTHTFTAEDLAHLTDAPGSHETPINVTRKLQG